MAKSIRFAVVGLGMGKGRSEVCRQTPGAELAAVCDLSEERGREAERTWGVPWVASYDELLAREDVDVVGLWTPSGSHAGMAVQALRAGKHVCMTKPMDITTAACDAAIHEAQSRGLLLAVDFEQRYRPLNQRIKAALDGGAIGDLLLVDLRMKWYRAQSYYDSGSPQSWRSRLDTEGGSLANQAVHFVDLMLWWAGDAVRVGAARHLRPRHPDRGRHRGGDPVQERRRRFGAHHHLQLPPHRLRTDLERPLGHPRLERRRSRLPPPPGRAAQRQRRLSHGRRSSAHRGSRANCTPTRNRPPCRTTSSPTW